MEKEKIFLGLDIGTNSVGWAVTNQSYKLKRYRGNLMWGVHLFDEANQAEERRSFRTSRRRLDRRQQRIRLLQDLLAPAVIEKDPEFFLRLKESALLPEDFQYRKHDLYFNDSEFNDSIYYQQYPTIHHLICELMSNDAPHDIRLIYIACAYLLGHRGHFLRDIDPDRVDDLLDFSSLYQAFRQWFIDQDADDMIPDDIDTFKSIMLDQRGVKARENQFKEKLYGKKIPKTDTDIVDIALLIKLLSGGTVKLSALFRTDSYSELEKDSVSAASTEFADELLLLMPDIQESHSDLLYAVHDLYDWSVLMGMLDPAESGRRSTISEAKVRIYETHRNDLHDLKDICGRYLNKKQFDEIFRDKATANNYVWYSYHFKDKIPDTGKRVYQEDFCKFIKKYLDKIKPNKEDSDIYERLIERAESHTLCPKQVSSDNRVIPYQLYYTELKCILENASRYISLLNQSDEYGTVAEKILSIMCFRVPYYVGPLVSEQKNKQAWMARKAEGKIYPWNFDEKVDRDESERRFIERMTCSCTYLAGETVLPKYSLLYSKFCVLNEINNLAIDGERISAEVKQKLYEDKFVHQKRRVTKKSIKQFLFENGYMAEEQTVSGVDDTLKSTLRSYHDFKKLMSNGILSESEAEDIIEHITVTKDKKRLLKWINGKYPKLSKDDARFLSNLNYSDYGRLSRRFLEQVYDTDPASGELHSEHNLINALWNTNENLMQLLSDRHGYISAIEEYNRSWYTDHPLSLEQRMDAMYLSKPVRRAVTRTLDIAKELRSLLPDKPDKIFIEMARGDEPDKKGKSASSRKEKIKEWLSGMRKELGSSEYDFDLLNKQLDRMNDNSLQSKKYYLYFMQLGRCMYSNKEIKFEEIANESMYNIDHIYPQSKCPGDSLDNIVLVLSELNGQKSDKYPIDASIRKKMHTFWSMLRRNELISQKKYERLTRSTPLTNEELAGFIQRQLVETRQSTKAVSVLLKAIFPDSEIVYVKAELASRLRHDMDMLKCRELNDLHHAKDAYLNIVIGNVFHERFTKRFFEHIDTEKYSLRLFEKQTNGNAKGLLTYNIKNAWDPSTSFETVRSMMRKNSIRYVRYCYRRKGGLFNQQPERAKENLISRKADLPTEKYGGYNNSTASAFLPVKYHDRFIIIPLELRFMEEIMHNEQERHKYAGQTLSAILEENADPAAVSFPLNDRLLKINTMLEVDGFRVNLIQKSNKGRTLVITSAESLSADPDTERYIKRLSAYAQKSENGKKYQVTSFDRITPEDNEKLFEWLCNKCETTKYSRMFTKLIQKIRAGKTDFLKLSCSEQAIALLQLVSLLKTGRSSGCDLKVFGASGQSGVLTLNSDIKKIKGISNIYVIDQSPTGLIERRSENLLTL
ncbi:MAG: type II CRISPR RNA-guided endonuclease Cas9 [Oscillospiraceae bacterium]|nr:type II CRISPR RNA-guided endonuclease Cas9 [Oscillospiraceae bacterium]